MKPVNKMQNFVNNVTDKKKYEANGKTHKLTDKIKEA